MEADSSGNPRNTYTPEEESHTLMALSDLHDFLGVPFQILFRHES
jgi:hypothetical protein